MICKFCGDLAGAGVCPDCQTEIHYLVEDLVVFGEPPGLSKVFDVELALTAFAPEIKSPVNLGNSLATMPKLHVTAAVGFSK